MGVPDASSSLSLLSLSLIPLLWFWHSQRKQEATRGGSRQAKDAGVGKEGSDEMQPKIRSDRGVRGMPHVHSHGFESNSTELKTTPKLPQRVATTALVHPDDPTASGSYSGSN